MEFDALRELRAAGILHDSTPAAVEEILGSLGEDEVRFLVRLNSQVAAVATPEVVSHSMDAEEDTPCFAAQMVIN